ncbi:MAG: YCF48-related protein [Bacteroidota bacterium]|nr:YCF48-related protein [Bacteroidota bacterium]
MKLVTVLLALLLSATTLNAQKGWVQKHQEGEDILFTIECLDADNIVAAGSAGLILRSTDAGESWQEIPSGATDVLRRVRWYNAQLGVILGNEGVALKSTDAGASWQRMTTGTSDALFDIHFFDAQRWLAIGRGARVISTTDGGGTWENESSGLNNYNELAFRGELGLIVGNKGTIRRTIDGGGKWTGPKSGTDLELTSVSFGDDSTAIIAGINGTILRSSDYGKTWEQVYASIPISIYRLSGVRHLTRDHVIIVGYGGIILESTDAGLTWTPQESNTSYHLEAVSFVDERIGCAAGWATTVMRTTSGGSLSVTRSGTALPAHMSIASTWPNPLSRSAGAVAHVMLDVAQAAPVDLRVYDLLGREVQALVDMRLEAGNWDITWDPSALPKGVYLYRLRSRDEVHTAKITLID